MQTGLRRLAVNLSQYNPAKILEEIVGQRLVDVVELQRDQLYAGLDGTGRPFKLKYSQDPYFKTPEAGRRYGKWKSSLLQRQESSLFRKRDTDTPNLIVNGNLLYNRIIASVSNGKLIINDNSPIIGKLEAKYGMITGLGPVAWNWMMNAFLIEEFKQRTNEAIKR